MKKDLKTFFPWALYDWANSAFPTLITTFIFSTYFTEKVAINKIVGTHQWGDAIALAGLIIAITSPVFGAIADHEGRRKPWLFIFTLLCIVGSALLWTVHPHPNAAQWALTWVVVGTIGLEVGMVFYNAMLSDLAPESHTGRWSGWAWGIGYFGGLTALVIALFVFIKGDVSWLHLDTNSSEQIRIVGPFVALWFALFSWPLFVFTPDRPSTGLGLITAARRGVLKLISTLISLRNLKEIFKFLVARMLYIDGLNTVFSFGGIYAAGTFGMNIGEVIQFGIAMNVAAGLGAIAFAWLDDFRGAKPTVLISLVILIVCATGMLITHSKLHFWLLGMGLSICVGPVQAASRSLLIHIAPKEIITEMFGLYAFSGKATAFIGPWLLGLVTLYTNSQRWGMATVLGFFIVGGLILLSVRTSR